MPPTPGYDPIGTVQQAITGLLSAQEPQFIGIGNRLFLSFATILLVWHGIRLMLAWRESGEHMFSFARLLLVISFGYAMIAYYETNPLTGLWWTVAYRNLLVWVFAFTFGMYIGRTRGNVEFSGKFLVIGASRRCGLHERADRGQRDQPTRRRRGRPSRHRAAVHQHLVRAVRTQRLPRRRWRRQQRQGHRERDPNAGRDDRLL